MRLEFFLYPWTVECMFQERYVTTKKYGKQNLFKTSLKLSQVCEVLLGADENA
jgi:hypothetical protein